MIDNSMTDTLFCVGNNGFSVFAFNFIGVKLNLSDIVSIFCPRPGGLFSAILFGEL